MSELAQERFLQTRGACLVALMLAVMSFSADVWLLFHRVHRSKPYLGLGPLSSHVPKMAVTTGFYALLLWGIVLSWVRTRGRERVFIVGWFTYPALLGILASMFPQWRLALALAGLLGPAAAILAALSLLLDPQIGTQTFTASERA